MAWSTKNVQDLMESITNGESMPRQNPFSEGDTDWRGANIAFEYEQSELEEIVRCQKDILYFANNYCFSKTDNGIEKIRLRDYQEKVIESYAKNERVVFLASRQIGKTITSCIFLSWYMCFHFDKNVLVIANKRATSEEILDKTKTILRHLPFFMKPGVKVNNMGRMAFDNGCRIFAEACTETPAIGFTFDVIFADEFAHIPEKIARSFYKSILPTLSSIKNSKMLITSTANGLNLFYEIYDNAIKKKSEFVPLRVDWWQVPGRDEAWKQKWIADLGSEEAFNQEFGNQFVASSSFLLDGQSISFAKRCERKYEFREIETLHDQDLDYKDLTWDSSFDFDYKDNNGRFRTGKRFFVLSIDLAEGANRDYTILNIFQLVPLSMGAIRRHKMFQGEVDFFGLKQVGVFRSNTVSISDFVKIVNAVVYDILGEERLKIVLEMNYNGNYFLELMSQHEEFFTELFVTTKHKSDDKIFKPGIKLNNQLKRIYCEDFRPAFRSRRLILTHDITISEFTTFGVNEAGTYSNERGHDDLAMSCVNLMAFFKSAVLPDCVSEIWDEGVQERYKKEISKKIDNMNNDSAYSVKNMGDIYKMMRS
jgi:hypothetical protein